MLFPPWTRNEPPTEFALKLRPWFFASLVVNMAFVVGKFIIHDYVGALVLFLVVLTGLMVLDWSNGIQPNVLIFTVIATIEGIFDVISCIMYFQHSKYKLFDEKATQMALLAQVIFLLSPVALALSAGLSFAIFQECQSNPFEEEPLLGGPFGGIPYIPPDEPRRANAPPGGEPQRAGANQPNRQGSFQHFQGTGFRLGND
mmetsp:Transcript_85335/g.133323  ORF Transcript_85335/g.133323 Transcript_85335/m.133323 type:complete len:201 (-) Transcript_85335:23-625(-)